MTYEDPFDFIYDLPTVDLAEADPEEIIAEIEQLPDEKKEALVAAIDQAIDEMENSGVSDALSSLAMIGIRLATKVLI